MNLVSSITFYECACHLENILNVLLLYSFCLFEGGTHDNVQGLLLVLYAEIKTTPVGTTWNAKGASTLSAILLLRWPLSSYNLTSEIPALYLL